MINPIPPIPFIKVALAVGVLLVGFLAIKFVSHAVYTLETKRIISTEDIIFPGYKQKVQKETDVSKLARVANNLSQKNLYTYASLNFKRASDLDPNYREMAYGWAYAILHATNGKLSPQDLTDLHTALTRAEAVDPLYKPTLELKKLIAQLENDKDAQAQADQRLKLLQPSK